MAERSPEEEAEQQINKLEAIRKDYIACFSTASGKRVLTDLEKQCFINKTTFSPTKGRTLLNEGMRFVVVHIKNMMSMDIETLKKLAKGE